jgi:hypothetical protein
MDQHTIEDIQNLFFVENKNIFTLCIFIGNTERQECHTFEPESYSALLVLPRAPTR